LFIDKNTLTGVSHDWVGIAWAIDQLTLIC
jgi:hypothetical protein